ncbi:MAG: penicillin-binding protein 1C, partial [Spirochaetes bacterium GWE2_31_10]
MNCRKKLPKIFFFFLIVIFLFIFYPVHKPFQDTSYSTVMKDANGYLLGATISNDQQWRFPVSKNIPEKYRKALITYEDKNFYIHPGVDPFAVVRAVVLNSKAKRIVSGGSTITMQVVRLSRKNKKRIFYEKLIEAILSVKYEINYSKKYLLSLYSSHAPFGGNVVGLDAATWRYFGREPDTISWAEAALLAILPNNPAMIYPGKNNQQLLDKRNRLLVRLLKNKTITDNEYQAALFEPLPEKPYPIPQNTYHLLSRAIQEGFKGKSLTTTIDRDIQLSVDSIVNRHGKNLANSRIFNAAALVLDVDSGNVLAYIGNTTGAQSDNRGNAVDIIRAARSSGSILKPLLYSCMLDEGELLPDQLIPDIPLNFQGFAPQNFNNDFSGVIPASQALTKSLNIPFVYLLHSYGYQKFHHRLKQTGISLPYSPSHYSLTLILGGAETNLWELSAVYAGMARTLKYQTDNKPFFYANKYIAHHTNKTFDAHISPAAVWFTFKAMKEVSRPNEENRWRDFSSSKPIAWKTGTSYGNKDAWAIGVTPQFIIAVWVGNASGEGRPEITGVTAAGPILLDIHTILPDKGWFSEPVADMIEMPVCKESGFIASRFCDASEVRKVPRNSERSDTCQFHKTIHLDADEKYQVTSENYPVSKMIQRNYFILPPIEEYFYRKKNPSYKKPPPEKDKPVNQIMGFVYPNTKNPKVFIPIELDGSKGKSIFEIVHRNSASTLYWHLDGEYLGETKGIHKMQVSPAKGKHEVVAVDLDGNTITLKFEVD